MELLSGCFLVRRQVAAIAAIGNAAAMATTAATPTIPIVFLATEDPVKLGLVASLARPNGNATGINFYSGELTAKRLELLRDLVPAATRVAVLVNPANAATTETTLRDVAAPARAMGMQIQVLNASTSRSLLCLRSLISALPPCVDGSELARTFFTCAELVGAPMCSAC